MRRFVRRGVACRPHPTKYAPCGEDAYLLSDSVLAVADGVGGWRKQGIDSGEYSRGLMHSINEAMSDFDFTMTVTPPPRELLRLAAEKMKTHNVLGSATVAIAVFDPHTSKLRACHLGDSGIVVLRGKDIVYESKPQMHHASHPFQIGNRTLTSADDAHESELDVVQGDVVLVATDGIFDNVWPSQIADIFASYLPRASVPLHDACHDVIELCHRMIEGTEPKAPMTPMRDKLFSSGYEMQSLGKLDDMAIVAGIVEDTGLLFSDGTRTQDNVMQRPRHPTPSIPCQAWPKR